MFINIQRRTGFPTTERISVGGSDAEQSLGVGIRVPGYACDGHLAGESRKCELNASRHRQARIEVRRGAGSRGGRGIASICVKTKGRSGKKMKNMGETESSDGVRNSERRRVGPLEELSWLWGGIVWLVTLVSEVQ